MQIKVSGRFLEKVPFKGYIYTSIAINVAVAVFIWLLSSFLPPVVPLLYGKPTGEGQLVPTLWLMTGPAVSVLVTFINTFLAAMLKNLYAKKIVIISAFLVSLLTTVTVVKIILLVGFF